MANFSKSFNFRNGVQVDDDKFIVKPTTGLVGIGSTAPTQLLDVAGNIKSDGVVNSANVEVGTGITVGINSSISIDGVTGLITAVSYFGDGSTLTNVVAIATAGFTELSGTLSTTHSVGIGSTQPFDFKLDVIGATRVVGPSTFVGVTTVSDLFADALGVSGVSKLTGGAIIERGATIDQANVTGVSTFTGISTNTSLIQANGLSVAGVSTFIGDVLFRGDGIVRFGQPFGNVPRGGAAIFYGSHSTGRNMTWDGGNLVFDNFAKARFGNTIVGGLVPDMEIYWNGSRGVIEHYGGLSITSYSKGDVIIDSGLSVVGVSTLRNLNVTGISTLNSDVRLSSGLNVSGISTFNGAIDANAGATLNQLNVTGVSTLTGRLTATEINSAAGNQVKLLQGGTQVFNTIGAGVSVFNSLSVGSLNGGTSGLSTHTGQLVYGSEGGLGNYGTRRSLNLVNTDYGNINFILNLNNLKDDLTNTGAIDRTGSFIWHKSTGTQLMTLTGIGGSLGIGITTPDSPLHVAGDAKFGNDVTIVNDLVIGNDLNVTGGTINANVIGDLEGNVYAQTGVSTFANVVFADDLTVSGTTFSASFGANTSSMLTVKPTNQATGGEGTIIRAVAGSNNYYLSNDGFVGIRTSDKFSNIIVNGSNANAVFNSFGVGSYDHFQSTQLQRGAVDFANAGVSTQRYMVPPKVTTTERNALSGLVEGAMIYNTNNNRLEIYTQNSNWVGIATVA